MKQAEKAAEPPSSLRPLTFMIGQDSAGHWVVCEPNGTRGGLFINRAEALRYVRFESENHSHPAVFVSSVLEFDAAGKNNTASFRKSKIEAQPRRQVA